LGTRDPDSIFLTPDLTYKRLVVYKPGFPLQFAFEFSFAFYPEKCSILYLVSDNKKNNGQRCEKELFRKR
jgi:hypothetical protein